MESDIVIHVPSWVGRRLAGELLAGGSFEAAMALAIELARENVRRGTGGPFGALVVDPSSGEILGAGVNLVTSAGLSCAHAEIVALSTAQLVEGNWDLGQRRPLALVSSCEPCAMCFGAVPWSGVRILVYGARHEDAQAAGFDEGDKPEHWVDSLTRRGIAVYRDVLREAAAAVLRDYLAAGGEVYNPGGEGA